MAHFSKTWLCGIQELVSCPFPRCSGPALGPHTPLTRHVPESITLERLLVPGQMTRRAEPLGQMWQDVTNKRQPCCIGRGRKQMWGQDSGDDLVITKTRNVLEEGEKEVGIWQYVRRQDLSVGSRSCSFQRFLTSCLPTWNYISWWSGGRRKGVEKADAKRDCWLGNQTKGCCSWEVWHKGLKARVSAGREWSDVASLADRRK